VTRHFWSRSWVVALSLIGLILTGCSSTPGRAGPIPSPSAATATLRVEGRPTPTVVFVPTALPPEPAPRRRLLDLLPLGTGRMVPRVTMDIVLNYLDRRLQVTQDVLFANDTAVTWDEVVLAVLPAYQTGVFVLDQVEVTTVWRREVVAYTMDGIMLHVPVPEPLQPGEPVAISLIYAMKIPQVDPAGWLPEGNLGAGERVIQAGDWHPTLVPYHVGEGWQTWAYHPVGDPVVYPIADYDVQIFAEPDIIIAAPGLVSEDGPMRRYRITDARCFAFLASPDYLVAESSVDGIPLRTYYLPGHDRAAQATLDTAAQAIMLYDDLYGPYPEPGLVIAQNAYIGSMEYSGLASLSDRAYEAYVDNPRAALISLTAHEVAHQWWYGAVGNDQVHEPWLDEAFAKYSEQLFYERYVPELVDWWWEIHVYRYDPEGPVDRTIYDFSSTPEYFDQLYGQAARFLGDLRGQMGDEAFFKFVRAYRRQGEGKLMTGEDFLDLLFVSTDEDLQPLVDRYFETVPGD